MNSGSHKSVRLLVLLVIAIAQARPSSSDGSNLKITLQNTNTYYASPTDNMNQTDNKVPYFVKIKSMRPTVAKPAGSNLQLRCQAAGDPPPNITWYKNGFPNIRAIGDVKYKRYNLEMESSTSDDSGNYTCVVCNEHGCKNFTYKVHIIEKLPTRPYIRETFPKNVTVLVHGNATFQCPPISDLEPYILWIKPDPNVNATETVPNGIVLQNGAKNVENPEIFTIKNVTHSDEGWYTCIAGNTLGNTSASAYLKVVDTKQDPLFQSMVPRRSGAD